MSCKNVVKNIFNLIFVQKIVSTLYVVGASGTRSFSFSLLLRQSAEREPEVWPAILSVRSFLLFGKSTERNCIAHGITNRTFINKRASWQTTKLLVQSFIKPERVYLHFKASFRLLRTSVDVCYHFVFHWFQTNLRLTWNTRWFWYIFQRCVSLIFIREHFSISYIPFIRLKLCFIVGNFGAFSVLCEWLVYF